MGTKHIQKILFLLVCGAGISVQAQESTLKALPFTGRGAPTVALGSVAAATPTPSEAEKEQDKNALLEAFKSLLGGGGGGGGGGQNQGGGGNSELASGGGSGGGDFGGGGASGSWGGAPTSASELSGGQSIVEPFKRNFERCAQENGLGTCKFENMGIMGDAAHRARRSCHNAGEAIDVGPLTCTGANKIATNHPKFFDMAKCLANNSNDELQVIFHRGEGKNMIRKSDHVGHMHVQLKNCRMIYGQ